MSDKSEKELAKLKQRFEASIAETHQAAPQFLTAKLKKDQRVNALGLEDLRKFASSTEEALQCIDGKVLALRLSVDRFLKERPSLFVAAKEEFLRHLDIDFAGLRNLIKQSEEALVRKQQSSEIENERLVDKLRALLLKQQAEIASIMNEERAKPLGMQRGPLSARSSAAQEPRKPVFRLVKLPMDGKEEATYSDRTYFEWPDEVTFSQMREGDAMVGLTLGSNRGSTISQVQIHLRSGRDSPRLGYQLAVSFSKRLALADPSALRDVRILDANQQFDIVGAMLLDAKGATIDEYDPGSIAKYYTDFSTLHVRKNQTVVGVHGFFHGKDCCFYRLGLIVAELV